MSAQSLKDQTANEQAPRPKRWFGRLRLSPMGAIGLLFICLVIGCSLFAPWIVPLDPGAQETGQRLLPPGTTVNGVSHWLGTDQLGRDLASRTLYGGRISLLVGLVTVGLSGAIGLVLGLLAGYFGGRLEAVIMMITEIFLGLPFILIAIVSAAVWGPGLKSVILILALTSWVVFARVVHGATLVIRHRDFVEAARAVGASDLRILFRHLLPQVLGPFVVICTLQMGRMLIAESALSFLGIGMEPAIPTWGSILGDGRAYIHRAPWILTFPGIAMTMTVLGINFTGEWLKQQLDPLFK